MASPAPLTAARVAELREAFALFVDPAAAAPDTVPAAALGAAVRALGHSPTEAEVAALVARAGGGVGFEEFVSIVASLQDTVLSVDDITAAFRVLDKDGDGRIPADELRSVLMARGEKLSEEEANELVALVKPDKDGMIDYRELSAVLMG
jgi:calcium-binding protein CML